MKKILSLFTLLFAFFGMAWAQDTTKPFKVSGAPTETGWAANTTWYYIKSVRGTAWLSTQGNKYVHQDGTLLCQNTNQPTDDYGLWCFVGNDKDGYTIYNKGKGKGQKLGMTKTNSDDGTAKMYGVNENPENIIFLFDYVASTYNNAAFDKAHGGCFKLHGDGNYYWNVRGGNKGDHLATWNDARAKGDEGSAFTFVQAEPADDVAAAKAELQSMVNTAKGYLNYIGEGVNKYTQAPEHKQPLNSLIGEAEKLLQAEGTKKGEYQVATAEIKAVVDGLIINQPVAGHFYAFKGKKNGKYIDGSDVKDKAHNQFNAITSDKANGEFKAGHVFYLTADKNLLNYAAGYYFVETHSIKAGTANKWTFHKSKGGKVGYYTLQADTKGVGTFLYDNFRDQKYFCDRNSSYEADNCDWAIEEVTTLPVTVSAAGWATLYAPVALTIPTGLTGVYTAAVEGNTLKLTALNDEIPANTPVLIEAAEGKYNFNINYNAAAQTAQAAGKGLSGTLETINKPATTIYTLQKPENKNIGFYKYNGQTLQGFRAYGENLLGTTSTAEGLIFDKGDVTAIENVEINDGKQTVIYDLSGRRVEKMLKGIYIVNGKKVIK